MVTTLEQMQVPNGTGPGVRRSKRPLPLQCSMETSQNLVIITPSKMMNFYMKIEKLYFRDKVKSANTPISNLHTKMLHSYDLIL